MTLQEFENWLTYSDKCNALLAETLKAAPQTFDAPFQTESANKSVRDILAHIYSAEERVITVRLQGKPLPTAYQERAATTLDGIFADAAAIRAQTRAFFAPLTDADLSRTYEIVQTLTLAEVLFHLVTHEMYHRGQITMALQRQGIDTPNFDYILLK